MTKHLRCGSDYDETSACGADGPTVANIDDVDCPECADIWDDWCELNEQYTSGAEDQ